MDMIGKVRRMKLRDGLSYSEIARRTGLSRNTVKKWLKAGSGVEPRCRRERQEGKLTPFEATLVAALKADAHRPREHRRTAKALLVQLQAQGYRGGYTTLTDFIRLWRADSGKTATITGRASRSDARLPSCRKVSAWIRYISKRESKDHIPISAWAYGYGGLDESAKDSIQKDMLPRWLKTLLPAEAKVRRVPKVGGTDMTLAGL